MGLCQLSVTTDKKRNISHAKDAIEEAASKGAKLVLLSVSFPPSLPNCFCLNFEFDAIYGSAHGSILCEFATNKKYKVSQCQIL